MIHIKTSCLLSVIFSILILSCRNETPTPIVPVDGLTDDQTQAMYWADWGAGIATAELGPVSIFVAAAASAAYYYDHKKSLEIPNIGDSLPITIEVSSINSINEEANIEKTGIDHNNFCIAYLNKKFSSFNLLELKRVAVKVRPDLENELNKIDNNYTKDVIKKVCAIDYRNAQNIVSFIHQYVNLTPTDEKFLSLTVNNLVKTKDMNNFVLAVDKLIKSCDSFSLSNSDKMKLKNSFSILKHSRQLWEKVY